MHVVLVTGNQYKRDEIARLLAGIDVSWRKVALSRPPLPLAHLAKVRAAEAFALIGTPCITETTELALEGLPVMSGAEFKAQMEINGEATVCRALGGRRGRARVAVAYAASPDAATAQVFEGQCEGEFLQVPRGTGGHGWDRAFLPDGYTRTLGEMAGAKPFVNMRERPYLELADKLRGRSYGGTFEAHVTVKTGTQDDVARFAALCGELGVKHVLIELPQGETQSQPMTASYHHGTLNEAIQEVHAIARALAAGGFDVTRVKLEAVGSNRDVPEDDAQAKQLPQNYFEYHVKVMLPPGADMDALRGMIAGHNAHLSKNARKVRADGWSERFVTLRVYRAGRRTAEVRFGALVGLLESTGWHLGQKIREYTVYDSDVGVDRGWLPQP